MPPELQALLNSEPIYDVHNYLVVHSPQGETVVDATWPLHLKAIGLPANGTLGLGASDDGGVSAAGDVGGSRGSAGQEHKAAVLQHMYPPPTGTAQHVHHHCEPLAEPHKQQVMATLPSQHSALSWPRSAPVPLLPTGQI